MSLLTATIHAPWCGIDPDRLVTEDDTVVIHRVSLDGLPVATWATADRARADCGANVRIIPTRWCDLRTRDTSARRCRACNPKVRT